MGRQKGRHDILQMYLKAGVDPNSYTLSGMPMLSHAACEGQIESARILLHYGADPRIAKSRGTGEVKMIELVLRAGAKITSLKPSRFICCVPVNTEPLVQLAIMNGTEFLGLKDNWGETVLHKAVRYNEGLAALILKAAPELLHERTSDGRTLFMLLLTRVCSSR
ncbi:hypothetical protein AARAC_010349 [Aspergillus arachidicola]|uniref:Uncharacterized protein n=1 Tax=Aspergillus arachidicola TaxID=656916 RepID=A0A2G7FH19_9EURO|nr:hypothetical protein AARAC_010349 [Aspergillus arachidicola]